MIRYNIPVVISNNKLIDSFFRFDLDRGFFDGTSPLNSLDEFNILSYPNSTGLIFDSRAVKFYKSTDVYSYGSMGLLINPYIKQAASVNNNLIVSGILDGDYKNFAAFTDDLSDFVGFYGNFNSYGVNTRSVFAVVGDLILLVMKNLLNLNSLSVYSYSVGNNNISYLSHSSYGLKTGAPFSVFDDASVGACLCVVTGDNYVVTYSFNDLTSVSGKMQISSVAESSIAFCPDVNDKTCYVIYGDGYVKHFNASSEIREFNLTGLPYSYSTGNIWSRGLIARSAVLTSVDNRKLLLVIQYFRGDYRSDIPDDDVKSLSANGGIFLYDITDDTRSYYSQSGRMFLSYGQCIRGLIPINDDTFLVSVIDFFNSGVNYIYLMKVKPNALVVRELKTINDDIYQIANVNNKLLLCGKKSMYATKDGMAEKVVCSLDFEDTYTYPRTGTLNIKAYDIFDNEAYARIAIKLKSPNIVFDDGTSAKVVRFYPNNNLSLNVKLLYSSVVSIEADIIEVMN